MNGTHNDKERLYYSNRCDIPYYMEQFTPQGEITQYGYPSNYDAYTAQLNQQPVVFYNTGFPVNSVAYNPEGSTLVAGGGNSVDIFDLMWGDRTQKHFKKAVETIAINDANVVAVGTESGLELVGSDQEKVYLENTNVQSVSFSADGRSLAVGTWGNGLYLVYGITSEGDIAEVIRQGRPDDAIYSVAISADNKIAAAIQGGTIRIWNKDGSSTLLDAEGGMEVYSVAFSPDGDQLVAATGAGVRVWDILTQNEKVVIYELSRATSVAFSPDGQIFAAVIRSRRQGSDSIILAETESGEVIQKIDLPLPAYSIAFNPLVNYELAVGTDRGVAILSSWSAVKPAYTAYRYPC